MTTRTTISVDMADATLDHQACVTIQEVSKHRWYTKQLVVYRDAFDELWGFYYFEPATELQEDQDRFEADPVPIFRVVEREVTTTVYEEAPPQ